MEANSKNQPFLTTLKVLRCLLVYLPDMGESEKRKRNILIVLCIILRSTTFLTCCFPGVIHFIVFKKAKMDVDVSEDFPLFIVGTAMIMVIIIFPFFSKRWSILLNQITQYGVFGKPPDTEKTIKFCRVSSAILRMYCIIAAVIYGIAALYEAKKCLKMAEEKGIHLVCITMIPIWLPEEITIQTQWIIFFYQFILVLLNVIPAALICFLIWEVANMLNLHIVLLKESIKNIIKEKNKGQIKKNLGLWMSYHHQVLKLTKEFNFLTKTCMGLFSLIAALGFACISNQIVNMYKPLGAFLHIMAWFVALYLLCDAGQIVQDGTVSIGEAIYSSKWYATDIETQKDLLFILMVSQKPLHLEALPLGALNCTLMLTILKTAYSYLMFLKNTT